MREDSASARGESPLHPLSCFMVEAAVAYYLRTDDDVIGVTFDLSPSHCNWPLRASFDPQVQRGRDHIHFEVRRSGCTGAADSGTTTKMDIGPFTYWGYFTF